MPQSDGMVIRNMRFCDVPAISKNEPTAHGANSHNMLTWLLYYLTRPSGWHFRVGVVGKRLVGYCFGIREDRQFHIANLVVLPEFQNIGLGRLLLQDILTVAREQGYRRVYLEVVANNCRAIHLYEKYGFRRASTIPNYYRDGQDGLVMEHDLTL